jgi:hypothetical protein
MASKLILKPLELPRSSVFQGGKRLQPLERGEVTMNRSVAEHPFELADSEKFLFSHFADEHIQIIGTECDFFSQRVEKGTRDPLYDEPTERSFTKPFKIKAWVSWPSSTPVLGEEGFRFAFQTQGWIPRQQLEKQGAPAPFEGDVLRFWNIPYFNEFSVARDKIKNKGMFFVITNSDSDGHVNDAATFTGFRIDMKRRSEFGEERRIVPP